MDNIVPSPPLAISSSQLGRHIAGNGRLRWCDLCPKPCPLPTAIMAVVTSSTGGPLAGLFVDVSTPVVARIPCDQTSGRCVVSGNSGSYTLSFGATGYQTVQRTVPVTVLKAAQACGCDAVTTQQLQLMLVPL